MKNWTLYRWALQLIPVRGQASISTFSQKDSPESVFKRHRVLGGTLALFDESGIREAMAFGVSHLSGEKAALDTVYRAASISKFVTALGAMRLKEQGRLSLDQDVNAYLPFSLRHPKAPDTPITLRMLLSHTAGIHDGDAYNAGIARGEGLSRLLQDDSFTDHPPRTQWEYSNFGAGIAGVVMECACHTDFETLMQETVFDPLGVTATYYPQKVQGDLADAVRILPRSKAPDYNAAQRRARPLPPAKVDVEQHYALAHGSLCISVPELVKVGMAGMQPGFLQEDSLLDMRKKITSFGQRAPNLHQGIGTFLLMEPRITPHWLYGHQGMAYGAVHGLFFDPETGRGLAVLTTGASEARRGVLSDLNFHLLSMYLGKAAQNGPGD